MERLSALLAPLVDRARETPEAAWAVAGVLLLVVLVLLVGWLRRRRRKGRLRDFLCERNRKAIADALHSHCLRLRGKEPTFDLAALCRGGGLDAKMACCPTGGRISAVFGKAKAKGAVPPITVRCSRHGETRLGG